MAKITKTHEAAPLELWVAILEVIRSDIGRWWTLAEIAAKLNVMINHIDNIRQTISASETEVWEACLMLAKPPLNWANINEPSKTVLVSQMGIEAFDNQKTLHLG